MAALEYPPMRLGMFMMPVHEPGRPLHDVMAEDAEKTLFADEIGFDEVWIGEHFTATSEPIPSPMMFMASLLPRTRRISFGTGVINLPNRHPAVIAAEAAQFDHMTKGRFLFGVGTGSLVSDIELFGVGDEKERGQRLLESLSMIEHVWANDPPYDLRGKFWDLVIQRTVNPELGFGFMPRPYQKPRPPICIPVTSANSQTVRAAGRLGWGPISSALVSPEAIASHWRNYCEGRAEAGLPPSGADWRVVRSLYVAQSDAAAREWVFGAQSGYRSYYTYMRNVMITLGRLALFKPMPDTPDEAVTVESIIERLVVYGSVETVLAKLVALRERVGPFGHLLMTGMDWSGASAAAERQSMRRLAQDVMPPLRRHVAQLS